MTKDINQVNEEDYRHGYWEVYHANGKLDYKGYYHNGIRHGYWERYWSNGNLGYKGNYDNGKGIGYWEYYLLNGDLLEQIFYT